MRSKTAILISLSLTLAVSLVGASPANAARWSSSTHICTQTNPQIVETSGLSRSTYKRKVLFLHNDSGDSARFFVVSRKCKTRAVVTVRGVKARDWEDMASGPDHTLWFADIGDNAELRTSISVTRVNEPKKIRSRSIKSTTYNFVYPDGAHNAEGMMIRPKTGRLYIVTKNRLGGSIYKAPAVLDPNGINVLQRIGAAPIGITGADFARKGGRFVLRGYAWFYVYTKMHAVPIKVRVPSGNTAGEAITWSRNSRNLILGGEGLGSSLWKLKES